MPSALESKFHEAMLTIYRRAKVEENYNATIFRNMVVDRGGLDAARTLINSTKPSSGYSKLVELGRLDLSMEAMVVQSNEFHTLFTEHELEICRKRLRDYGFKF